MRTIPAAAILATLLAGLGVAPSAVAAPGDLDRSFGRGGKIVRDLSGASRPDGAAAVAVRADGRIVAVGWARRRTKRCTWGSRIAVARFMPSGKWDRRFARNGLKLIRRPCGSAGAADVALDRRGRIVVAAFSGYSDEFDGSFVSNGYLVRLRRGGRLDKRFSGNGRARLPVEGQFAPTGVAIDPSGKLVISGTHFEPDPDLSFDAPSDFIVARYRPNGRLDDSFSGDGWATTDLGSDRERAAAVAVAPDGGVVVGGESGVGGQISVALARYLPNGAPDPGFSNDGIVKTSVGPFADRAKDLVVAGDGKITVAGSAGMAPEDGGRNFLFARYLPDGELDPGFAGDGVRTLDVSEDDELGGLAVQADGALVAAGDTRRPSREDWDLALVRSTPDGAPDGTFSRNGIRLTNFGRRQHDLAGGLALTPRERIVVAGTTFTPRRRSDLALARFLSR